MQRVTNACSSEQRSTVTRMDTVSRGIAAETGIMHALARVGLYSLVPFGQAAAYDLAVPVPYSDRIIRVQVKCGRIRNNCVEFNACSTNHGRGTRPYTGRADVIAVYAPELGQSFVVPVAECPTSKGYVRLTPPRNNQRRRVRRAADYTLETWAESVKREASRATAAA